MGRWAKRLAVVAAVAAVLVLLRFTVFRPKPVPVTLHRVARGTVEETVSNSKAGTVTARRRARIAPQIGGQIEFIGPREGAAVKTGEVLLRINDRDWRANLSLARGELATSEAAAREACFTAAQAERDVRRNESLRDEKIISEEILERLRSQREASGARCEAAKAGVEQARAAIGVAQANLEKTVLRAPFAGIVAELKAEVGEWASPSPAAMMIPPIYDIIDPTSIYVEAPLDEVDAGRVTPGLQARITLDPFPGKSFAGHVARVAPYVQDIEQQNRTLGIEVEFDDAAFSRTLLPGTSADVEVILKQKDGVLRIPSFAILEGERVLRLENGKLAGTKVSVGLRNWEFTEVLEGLKEGDAIVVSLDRAEVKEGARAVEQKEKGEAHAAS